MRKNDTIRATAALYRAGRLTSSDLEERAMRDATALLLERLVLADEVGADLDDVTEQVADVLEREGWDRAGVMGWLLAAGRAAVIGANRERESLSALIAKATP